MLYSSTGSGVLRPEPSLTLAGAFADAYLLRLAEIGERGSAQEALRASEQRLQDILDNSTAVVSVKDLELRYMLVNREYEHRFHVQPDQIRGKPTTTFTLVISPKSYKRTIGK